MSAPTEPSTPEDGLWVRCAPCGEQRRLFKYSVSDNRWYICGGGRLQWIVEFLRTHGGWDGNHVLEFGLERDDHWWNPDEDDD